MNTIIRFFCPALLLLFLYSCSSDGKKDDKEESVSTILPDQIAEVSVMRLEFSDFYHDLVSNGTISASRKADVRFITQGIVSEIYVKNGDRVTKGQKIASLDRFKLEKEMEQAKDNLERAKLELQDVLIGQGYSLKDTANIPEEALSIARVKSNYDQSRINYELATYNLEHAVLYAPFSGVVANLFTKAYNQSSSDAFCTILDNSRPEIDFTVLESELSLIKKGDKVQVFSMSAKDQVMEGQVSEINPVVDKNGMVKVRAVINNLSSDLYDGMNVKVKVQRRLDKQLIIPKEALVLRTNRKVVFTYKNGIAQWVYVQTGLENSTSYVVTDGLVEGDSVIYEGSLNLAHETPVEIKDKR